MIDVATASLVICLLSSVLVIVTSESQCHSAFTSHLHALQAPRSGLPAGTMPEAFRFDGVRVHSYFVDDSNRSAGFHFQFNAGSIADSIRRVTSSFDPSHRDFRRLRETDRWLFDSLNQFNYLLPSLPALRVLVVGSMQPWHESLLISRVSHATTHSVDYNRLTFQHDRMTTFTVAEWTRAFLSSSLPAYDLALAILSVEHDGLGRYGDPVLGDGDLRLMRRMHCALRPGGRLMLAVALGAQDVIAWNLRRVYGPIRLPLLLNSPPGGWIERGRFGFSDNRMLQNHNYKQTYAPVFVLEKVAFKDEM